MYFDPHLTLGKPISWVYEYYSRIFEDNPTSSQLDEIARQLKEERVDEMLAYIKGKIDGLVEIEKYEACIIPRDVSIDLKKRTEKLDGKSEERLEDKAGQITL